MIRVSNEQYELISLKKNVAGYATLSQFIRDVLLKDDISTYKMIREIHQKLMGYDKNENKTGLQG